MAAFFLAGFLAGLFFAPGRRAVLLRAVLLRAALLREAAFLAAFLATTFFFFLEAFFFAAFFFAISSSFKDIGTLAAIPAQRTPRRSPGVRRATALGQRGSS